MKRAIVLLAVGLSACGGPSLSENQQEEVRAIADDISDANDAELRSRIDELESRLDDAERN